LAQRKFNDADQIRSATTVAAVPQPSLELQSLIFVLSVRLNETATTPVFV
jgi:hypothetical protein